MPLGSPHFFFIRCWISCGCRSPQHAHSLGASFLALVSNSVFFRQVSALRRDLVLGAPSEAASSSGRRRRHGRSHRRTSGGDSRFRLRVMADVLEVLYARQLRTDEEQLTAARNRSALRDVQQEQGRRLELLERRLEDGERERETLEWRLNTTDG